MNSTNSLTITNQQVGQVQERKTGTEHGKTGLQTLTASMVEQAVEQTIAQLPQLARSQINCINTLLHPLQDPKQLTQIYDAIDVLKPILQVPATLAEIDSLVNQVFVTIPSHNKAEDDIIAEKLMWLKLLKGQPYWAIELACDDICRTKRWRSYADLQTAINTQTYALSSKISSLKQIARTTVNAEKEKLTIGSYEDFIESFKKAAEQGNSFAKMFLKNLNKYN